MVEPNLAAIFLREAYLPLEQHNYSKINSQTDQLDKQQKEIRTIAKLMNVAQKNRTDKGLDLSSDEMKPLVDEVRKITEGVIEENCYKYESSDKVDALLDSLRRDTEGRHPLMQQIMTRVTQFLQEVNQYADITAESIKTMVKDLILSIIKRYSQH